MTLRHDESSASAAALEYSEEKSLRDVLVVDDTEYIRDVIACFLRPHGYRIFEAEDGLAAQKILNERSPTLVITDLEMPVSDGWTVLEYCHTHHPDMPVMIISGGALGRHPEIEVWAAASLSKPFNFGHLRREVNRLVQRRRCAA